MFDKGSEPMNLNTKKQRHKNIRVPEDVLTAIKIQAAVTNSNVVEVIDRALELDVSEYGDRTTYKETKAIKLSFEAYDKIKAISSDHGVSMTQVLTIHLTKLLEHVK